MKQFLKLRIIDSLSWTHAPEEPYRLTDNFVVAVDHILSIRDEGKYRVITLDIPSLTKPWAELYVIDTFEDICSRMAKAWERRARE